MANTIKKIYLLAILVSVCVVFSGCSRKPVEKQAGTGKVNLIFTVGGESQSYLKLLKEVVRAYKAKNPNINVKFIPIYGQGYVEKLLTMTASESAPDVFILNNMQVATFVQRKAILPLDPFMEKDNKFRKEDYFPAIVEGFTYSGKLYSLTDSMTPIVVFYNKSLFDDYKIPYPKDNWSWDDFLEISRKFVKKDERGVVKRYGALFYDTDVIYFSKAWGGSFWNKNKTKCVFNSPQSREGIQFLVDLSLKYNVVPPLFDTSTISRTDYQMFGSGMAGMLVGGRWYTIELRKAKMKFGIAELPAAKQKLTPIATHGWVISSGSRHPREAYDFVKYLCGEETVRFMMAQGDCVPPIKKIAEGDFLKKDPAYPDEDNGVYVRSMAHSYTLNEYHHKKVIWFEISRLVGARNMDKLLVGELDVEAYLKTVETQVNQLIKESK
ncbi:MAG: hypothetical protein A3J83_02230 [Elusimicrobia bacterium RIFOXYA2_FULL_40_6]|nr:MAG: hypothetical protein A3J83_02230 [Elusimicrobia bacterium RIFOXYA2_FULL_40_6]